MGAAESAAERVDYQLGFRRCPEHRQFGHGTLSGPDIDCAVTPGQTSRGGWYDWPVDELTIEEWINWFAMMALQEAVHESLEWFQVDGRPWLDPHVLANKIGVREAVVRLWEELRELRRTHQQASVE